MNSPALLNRNAQERQGEDHDTGDDGEDSSGDDEIKDERQRVEDGRFHAAELRTAPIAVVAAVERDGKRALEEPVPQRLRPRVIDLGAAAGRTLHGGILLRGAKSGTETTRNAEWTPLTPSSVATLRSPALEGEGGAPTRPPKLEERRW